MNFRSIPFLARAIPPAGGGSVIYHTVAVTPGTVSVAGLTATAPAGVAATDILVAFVSNIWNGVTVLPPDGWTDRGSIYSPSQGTGFIVCTAPGTVTDFTWQTASGNSFGAVIAIARCSGVNNTTPIRDIQTLSGDFAAANTPAPAGTASAGDVVFSGLVQTQSATAFGTPQADYTRIVDYTTDNGVSVLVRQNVAAGSTGTISHNSNIPFQGRALVTVVLAAA